MTHTIEADWTTKAGLRAVVVVHPMGHRCGYVAVPPEHKLHGEDYDNVYVDVHGGLTFAGGTLTYPAANDGLWWFGYDCAHLGDARDPELMAPEYRSVRALSMGFEGDLVRSLDYCTGECESLAAQLTGVGE